MHAGLIWLGAAVLLAAGEAAGGELTLVRRSTFDHHPHGLEPNETPLIVNFFNRANAPKEGK